MVKPKRGGSDPPVAAWRDWEGRVYDRHLAWSLDAERPRQQRPTWLPTYGLILLAVAALLIAAALLIPAGD